MQLLEVNLQSNYNSEFFLKVVKSLDSDQDQDQVWKFESLVVFGQYRPQSATIILL